MSTAHTTGATLDDLQWLQRFAVRLTRDADVADDLVQDTLVEAWRDPPSDRTSSVRPWLAGVLRNRFLLRMRGDRRRDARQQQAPAPAAAASPDVEQMRLEVLAKLLEALRTLPALDQKIIVRRFLNDETAADIARDLDVPPATVRTRTHRALARLRELLDERFGERGTWCAAVLAVPVGIDPTTAAAATKATTSATTRSSTTMSITAKILIAASASTATFAGWMATRGTEPASTPTTTTTTTTTASASTDAPSATPRTTWEGRRTRIREQVSTAQPRTRPIAAPPVPTTRAVQPVHEVFRELVRDCVDDLESDKTGALTLAIREIGAPDVGTIFESVEVMHANVDDPEVVECLTQSMYAYVGPSPDEAFERGYTRTLKLGVPKDEAALGHQIIGRIVGAHIDEVKSCESKAADPRGQVTVALTIGGEGPFAKVTAQDSDLPEPVVACIVTATERWMFPKMPEGSTFEHTFVLPMPDPSREP